MKVPIIVVIITLTSVFCVILTNQRQQINSLRTKLVEETPEPRPIVIRQSGNSQARTQIVPTERPSVSKLKAILLTPQKSAIQLAKILKATSGIPPSVLLEIAGELATTNDKREMQLASILIQIAGASDPITALNLIESHFLEDRKNFGTNSPDRGALFAAIAKNDLNLALQRLTHVPADDQDRNKLIATIGHELLVQGHLEEGLNHLTKIDYASSSVLTSGYSRTVHPRDLIALNLRNPTFEKQVHETLQELPPGKKRNILLGGLTIKALTEGGAKALEIELTKLPELDPSEENNLIKIAINNSRLTSHPSLLKLIENRTAGDFRKKIMASVVSNWIWDSATEPADWIINRPPSDDRNQWIIEHFWHYHERDPKAAAKLLPYLDDPKKRKKLERRLLKKEE